MKEITNTIEILDNEDEWIITERGSDNEYFISQHKKCSNLLRDSVNPKAYYLDAINWVGEREYETFIGNIYIDDKNFELIGSSQFVRFPFIPKTFYVSVTRKPITKEKAKEMKLYYVEDRLGKCYYTVVRDPKELDEVFKYYDKKPILIRKKD